jgi:excisionase family DNA binding protein
VREVNATAAHERDDVAERLEHLEADRTLHLALLRTLSDRLAALEGREQPDYGAEMTVKQAAGASGHSQTTIRRWAKSGRIKARRIGGRVFVAK